MAAVHATSRAFGVAAAGLILISIVVICQMVFVRAVLGASSIWQTEFVMFAIIVSTFLGAPYIMLTRGHVAVDVVPLMISTSARRRLYVLGGAISLAFCGFFLYASVSWWYEAWHLNLTTPTIWRARLWIPYLAVPIGLALLCLQIFADVWMVFNRRSEPFEGFSPEEHP